MATLVAMRLGNGDLSIVAPRAFVTVQKQLAVVSHRNATVRAGKILPLEVPVLPALRATIMRNDFDAVLNDVPLRCMSRPKCETALCQEKQTIRSSAMEGSIHGLRHTHLR